MYTLRCAPSINSHHQVLLAGLTRRWSIPILRRSCRFWFTQRNQFGIFTFLSFAPRHCRKWGNTSSEPLSVFFFDFFSTKKADFKPANNSPCKVWENPPSNGLISCLGIRNWWKLVRILHRCFPCWWDYIMQDQEIIVFTIFHSLISYCVHIIYMHLQDKYVIKYQSCNHQVSIPT